MNERPNSEEPPEVSMASAPRTAVGRALGRLLIVVGVLFAGYALWMSQYWLNMGPESRLRTILAIWFGSELIAAGLWLALRSRVTIWFLAAVSILGALLFFG